MSHPTLPIIRLRPNAEVRAIRHGFPWVYSNELVTDRRTKALAPGTFAILEDTERRQMGVVAVNTSSKIIARMMDRDPRAVIDQSWYAARLSQALDHRTRLYDQPYYRLVHAESDGLPGVVIDRFGDTAVVQPNAAWSDLHLDTLVAALMDVTGITNVIKNGAGRARKLEGLTEETVILQGNADAPVPVHMNGATYMADVMGGQKTGLFYDQRPNHAFAASPPPAASPTSPPSSCPGCWPARSPLPWAADGAISCPARPAARKAARAAAATGAT